MARPYWPWYLVGVLSVVGTNLCELGTTYAVRYAVTAISQDPLPGWLGRELTARYGEGVGLLWPLGIALVALITVQVSLRFIWRWGFVISSVKIGRDMRRELYAHLQRLESSYFDHAKTGELMSIAVADVEAMRMFLGIGTLLLIDTTLYFCIVPYAMWHINSQLTLILLIPLPLIALLTNRVGMLVHSRFMACQEQLAAVAARARESIAGIAVTKGFVQEAHELATFSELSAESARRQLVLARIQAMFMPGLALMVGLEVFLLLFFGGQLVEQGVLSVGELVQMLMMAMMLTFPMMGLGWTISLLQRGLASHERYRELLDREPAIADGPQAQDREVKGSLEARGLTFSYPGSEEPALRDVSLELAAGGSLALVGEVGAGKSTLISLVPRLYEAPAGTLLIDGRPLGDYTLSSLRRAVALVPQEVFLFSASLADNVAFARPDASREEVERAIWIAGLENDVARLEQGYETMLGERGINLSGGQRQRLAIARAVLANPRVLILDDCLSAVDTRTEETILERLGEFMDGRTTLVSAHRLSTVQHCDRIAVLAGGALVELGSHAELLADGGWYARTWAEQQLEDER